MGKDTVTVERLNRSSLPDVLPLLRDQFPEVEKERWPALFEHPWESHEEYCGYGLVSGGRVVGYCGLLFSERTIDGRLERFCNTTSWVVEEPFRGHALSLVLPALQLKEHTYTDLSATWNVARWCERWGLRTLESKLTVLVPVGPAGRSRRRGLLVTADEEELEQRLEGEQLRLFRDHRGLAGCGQALATDGESSCFLVWSRIDRDAWRPYAFLQHVSEPSFFARHSAALRGAIAREADASFLAVDSRLLRGARLPLSYQRPLRPPRYYRSPRLAPWQVDNLYTELAVLGIATIHLPLPTPGKVFRHVAAPLLRRQKETAGGRG